MTSTGNARRLRVSKQKRRGNSGRLYAQGDLPDSNFAGSIPRALTHWTFIVRLPGYPWSWTASAMDCRGSGNWILPNGDFWHHKELTNCDSGIGSGKKIEREYYWKSGTRCTSEPGARNS